MYLLAFFKMFMIKEPPTNTFPNNCPFSFKNVHADTFNVMNACITGLHIQKAYTSLGTSSMQILLLSAYAYMHFCLRIAVRHSMCTSGVKCVHWCTHLGLIAIKMHICMSRRQKNLVYPLWRESSPF